MPITEKRLLIGERWRGFRLMSTTRREIEYIGGGVSRRDWKKQLLNLLRFRIFIQNFIEISKNSHFSWETEMATRNGHTEMATLKCNNKNLRPKLILTVLPEVNEKEVIVQRVPLVIEYLQNNWSWHGCQRKKNIAMDKKSAASIEANSSAASSSHNWPRANERQNDKDSQRKPTLGGTEPPATNFNSNGTIGMEEVADKLRQSALQAAIAKRRHLSLAEQALIELEKEDEAQTNESIKDNQPPSEPANDGILISSVSKMAGENVKSREDDVDTPPPKKHGRAG
uniref:Uncharacterized protein n=1 Tax=Globodera rostochiensis TaxID=31243 RepID=A0A914HJI1_GLORO